MKEESQNPWTDPELEARIVALVLGEASDFEREELNRLIEEWPDLAAFKETDPKRAWSPAGCGDGRVGRGGR